MHELLIMGAKPETHDELRAILEAESRWRLTWAKDAARLSGALGSAAADVLLVMAPVDAGSDALATLVDDAQQLGEAVIVVCPAAIDEDRLRAVPNSVELLVAPLRPAEVRSRI